MTDSLLLAALIDELTSAADAYYNLGNSPLTDEEFDTKQAFLASQSATNPDMFSPGSKGAALLPNTAVAMGTATNAKTKVTRSLPMLSLAKAKTEAEVISFATKMFDAGVQSFVLQPKLDGMAVSVEYYDGQIQRISTRGSGLVGEDITYLLESSEVYISGLLRCLPSHIQNPKNFEVRGELVMFDDQFEQTDKNRAAVHGEAFSNSRNAVAGIINKARLGLGYCAEMQFVAYSMFDNGKPMDMYWIDPSGFLTVNELLSRNARDIQTTKLTNVKSLIDSVLKFGVLRDGFDFPTDGVVIKPANEAQMLEKLGCTTHHPVSQLAFKYPSRVAITTINELSLTVGRTGRITIVALVEPVELDGVTVTRATCNNFHWVTQRDIRVGSTVELTRANEVIPFIKSVIANHPDSTPIVIPETCPVCAEQLSFGKVWPPQTLTCLNTFCPARSARGLEHAVSRSVLNIDGLSKSILAGLGANGAVNSLEDLYLLDLPTLANTKTDSGVRVGEKRAINILAGIEASKLLRLAKHLQALNITNLGNTMSKLIEKEFGSIDQVLSSDLEARLQTLDGAGEKLAKQIASDLHSPAVSTLVARLRAHGLFAAAPKESVSGDLQGLSFSISGAVPEPFANRGEWVDYLESQGASFHTAPRSNTSFMVGDETGVSAKNAKAQKLGVTFISPEQFSERFVR
jgi:DNA ligase (NAD+)